MTGNATETIAVEGVLPHPSYDSSTGAYDVAIAKLVAPANAQWARINADSSYPTYMPAVFVEAIGIGQTGPTSRLPGTLRNISMIYIMPQSCYALLQVLKPPNPSFQTLSSDAACVTDYSTMNGQCFGDEGGPLVKFGFDPVSDLVVGVMAK